MIAPRAAVLAGLMALSLPANGPAQSWTTDRTLTHRFDVGPATADPSRIGVHYDLRYEFHRTRVDPEGLHFGLAVSATGFEDMERGPDALSNGAVRTALTGRYYRSGQQRPLAPEVQARYLKLLDLDPTDLTEAQGAELDGLIQRLGDNRLFVSFDVTYGFEYSRLSDSRQHTLGAGVSGEVPAVHRFLGAISGITGTDARYRQAPVRFHLGLDYVMADDVLVGTAGVGDDYPRITGELAWATLVLDEFVLRAHWRADWVIGAPAAIADANRELNHLLQAWVVFPLADQAGIMLKYTAGRFAPDYRKSDELKAGLTVGVL